MSRKRRCKSQVSTTRSQELYQPRSPVKITNEDTPGSDVSSFNEDDYKDIMDLLGDSEAEDYEDKPTWTATRDELDPLEGLRLKYTGTAISNLHHICCINASRRFLLDNIKYPFFDTLFPGCLTSIRSKKSANGRAICEISKVKSIGHLYEVDGVLTNKVLRLKIGNRFECYQLTSISNFEWTEEMVKEYISREQKTKTVITHGYVFHKRGRLCNAKAYALTEKAEIEAKKLRGVVEDLSSCLEHAMDKTLSSSQMCPYCSLPGPSVLSCPGLRQ